MELFCGLDCGGTKTLCALVDENGKIVGIGRGGPSNYLSCSEAIAQRSIADSLKNAFINGSTEPCRIKYAYVSSAAVEVHCGKRHIPFFSSCLAADKITIDNDAVPVRFSAAGRDPAIVTISGTGSVTYAFKKEGFIKVGGWGPILGDEGSGYDIGRRAIKLATRELDGRNEEKGILEAICNHFGIGGLHSIHRILRAGDPRSLVASAAECVCRLYRDGNAAAARVLQDAAEEIVLSVNIAAKRAEFDKTVPLILSGSLLGPDSPLCDLVRQKLRDSRTISCILLPRIPAAVSSAALALYNGGRKEQARKLIDGYEEKFTD